MENYEKPGSMPEPHESRLPTAEEIAALPPDGGPDFNRLIHERSPYLLRHARNPVDWYPWGEEAFAKARREDKPIFLSIGYSTCHWCRVMEEECFEDPEIARLLNTHFVPVKVDREERPDVDNVYMLALQVATDRGGWPMSLFLTWDGKPFLVGTYFPREDRFGQPGFRTILEAVANGWAINRDRFASSAESLSRILEEFCAPRKEAAELGEETLRRARDDYAATFDGVYGGFGMAPKFPRSPVLSALLRLWKRFDDREALSMVETTLDGMARGGIRDHVGGGFHRYATDRKWLVPHFEKMLYDQAALARAYVETFQATGEARHAALAREILDYALRDLRTPEGAFASAEDSNSEGGEGRFYVWKDEEIAEILGEEEAAIVSKVYGVRSGGNYRDEATGEETGSNILHLAAPLEKLAVELDLDPQTLSKRLAAARKKLLAARERRARPEKDDKILADWNGLMISALAVAGSALAEPAYLRAASEAAAFVLEKLYSGGRLLHTYRAGSASVPGYLQDYAFLASGLEDLYEATLESQWIFAAKRLADDMLRLFWDEEHGGLYFSGKDAERLFLRLKDTYDGSVPSGSAAAALLLLSLARRTGEQAYEDRALETLQAVAAELDAAPSAYPSFLAALDFALGPASEIVLVGERDDPELGRMREVVATRFLPRKVLLYRPLKRTAPDIEEFAPFLSSLVPPGGRRAAYVCENRTCAAPVGSAEELAAILDARR